jgi:ABC-2 type transport system permease protein
MTPVTEPATPATAVVPAYRADQRVTQLRVIRSEWTKLRSLRSAVWLLLTAVALIAGAGLVNTIVLAAHPPHGAAAVAAFDPAAASLAGIALAELATGALGVLLITGEYATGQVRITLAAVPRRLPVLAGKAVVLAAATLATCIPAVLVTFAISQSILSAHHLSTTLSQPGVARALLGSALFLAAVGLLGLGLGTLLRSSAGALAALFGVLYALTIGAGFLPQSWAGHVRKFLPENAGSGITTVGHSPGSLAPWAGFGLLCLYTAVVLGLAAWRLRRRDA